ARAADAARILDEAFNGPKQQAQQQGRGGTGGFSPFSMMGGLGGMAQAVMPSTPAAPARVRGVADPGSNSLLVRASPLDMMEIHRLLKDAIDSGASDSLAILKTYLIGPLKYSNATEVANVIRDVYREFINNNSNSNGFGATFGGFSFVRP